MLSNLLPHRLIGAVLMRQRFARFARMNGLVYFGLMQTDDDHDPIRGFTANAGQIDAYAMHGNLHGREVNLFERTVRHSTTTHGQEHRHAHTWLIIVVSHEASPSPNVLLLSHEHPRLHDEAIAVHSTHSRHVAIDPRIDAKFLVYAKPTDTEDFRDHATDEFVDYLVNRTGYDYEVDSKHIYIYSHTILPTIGELNQLLSTALLVADAYEGDIQKSPDKGSSSL